MYIPKRFKVRYNKKKGKFLIANENFKKDEILIQERNLFIKTRYDASDPSVQVGRNKFVDSVSMRLSDYINHGCDPNTKYDIENFRFTAIRNIKKGEEISYNYFTTEWDMKIENLDFDCYCGSPKCLGHISGYKYLSKSQQKKILQKPVSS